MGVINQGILGGVSGKVGSVTGASWKGINYLKARPVSVANPQTAAQIAQRNKMAGAVDFYKNILSDVIKPLNDRFASKMSGFNLAVQNNITCFTSVGVPNTPALIQISQSMNKAQLIDAISSEPLNSINITWVSDEGKGFALGSDLIYVVAWNVTKNTFAVSAGQYDRNNEVATVQFADGDLSSGDTVHVYLAALRVDGTKNFKTAHSSIVYA